MKRGAILILVGILFLSAGRALAALEISEIMYDLPGSDQGREWIEVFNSSAEPVDPAKLKFFEADTNHKLTFIEGSANLQPGGYAVIVSDPVKFKADWPAFSGTIFDSTFSLSNAGEMLAIKNEDQILDQYSYSSSLGAGGDGNSIGKIAGRWVINLPTPGAENKNVAKAPVSTPKTVPKSEVKKETAPESLNLPIVPIKTTQETSSKNSFIFYLVQLVFLVTTSILVYFVRRKKKVSSPGDDFDISDE